MRPGAWGERAEALLDAPCAGELIADDVEIGTTLVSRDPLGRQPLVYFRVDDGVLYAEHECDLVELSPSTPAPDALALKSWLESGTFPADRTLYEGIRRVPPGHRLIRGDGPVAVERHWSPRYEGTVSGSREELAGWLREQAFAAVDRAAVGSGLTAVRLSGGLDSAAIAAGLAARPGGAGNSVALSAVFPDHPGTDERELIEVTTAKTGIAARQVGFEPGREILPAAIRHLERWRLPPATPNLFVWEPLMALARELGVETMLDGEGGDELFGTAPFLIAEMLRRGRPDRAWALCGRIPGVGEHPDLALRARALRVFGVAPLTPARALRRRRLRRAERGGPGSLLAPADRVEIAALEGDRRPAEGPLWWRGLVATFTGGDELEVAGQLRREAIAEGVDRRHPFLFDQELVEAVLRVPPELGFDPVRDRPLLRDALVGYVPEAVRRRREKARFNPLLHEALAGPEGERLLTGLADSAAPVRAYLDQPALERLLACGRPTGSDASELRFWRLAMANLWLRRLESG